MDIEREGERVRELVNETQRERERVKGEEGNRHRYRFRDIFEIERRTNRELPMVYGYMGVEMFRRI